MEKLIIYLLVYNIILIIIYLIMDRLFKIYAYDRDEENDEENAFLNVTLDETNKPFIFDLLDKYNISIIDNSITGIAITKNLQILVIQYDGGEKWIDVCLTQRIILNMINDIFLYKYIIIDQECEQLVNN